MNDEKNVILIKDNTVGYLLNGTSKGSVLNTSAMEEGKTFNNNIYLTTGTINDNGAFEVQTSTEPISTYKIGENSFVMGSQSAAPAPHSFSFGIQNLVSGEGSIAIGYKNSASGYGSVALGRENVAGGGHSFTYGYGNQSIGEYSYAGGLNTEAWAIGSHSEGIGTIATTQAQHVEGKYNILDTETQFLHIIGNGQDNANRSNAMTVDKNGNGWFAGKITVGEKKEKLVTTTELEKIKPKIDIVEYRLFQTNWYGDGRYPYIEDMYPSTEYLVIMEFCGDNYQGAQTYDAYTQARIVRINQGSNNFKALGTIPNIDIDVYLIIIKR